MAGLIDSEMLEAPYKGTQHDLQCPCKMLTYCDLLGEIFHYQYDKLFKVNSAF